MFIFIHKDIFNAYNAHSEAKPGKCKSLFGNFDPGIHRRVKHATELSSEGQIGRIPVPGGSVRALKMK